MTEPCEFCKKPLNPYDEGTHKQVTGWVHGKKSDGMVLREYTGKYAHEACIRKQVGGQAPDQPDMFNTYLDRRLEEPDVKAGFDAEDESEDLTLLFLEEEMPPPTQPARRCDMHARKGTGSGVCDTPLDEKGRCPNAGNHLTDVF